MIKKNAPIYGFNYVSIILIILGIAIIYSLIFIAPAFYHNYLLKQAFIREAVKSAEITDQQILDNLKVDVEHLKIPIRYERDITIERQNEIITISTKYEKVLPWINKKIPFKVKISRPIKPLAKW